MKRPRLAVAFLILAALAALTSAAAAPTPVRYAVTGDVDVMHPKDANHKPPPARNTNVNMVYHGGPIMPTAVTKAIFWGPKWANSTFIGDKRAGLDSFYTGFSGSNYAITSDEYTGTNGKVGATTTYQGHIVDTSTAGLHGPAARQFRLLRLAQRGHDQRQARRVRLLLEPRQRSRLRPRRHDHGSQPGRRGTRERQRP